MIGRINSLLFPRLVHIRDAKKFKSEAPYVGIYSLDWSTMENILKEKNDKKNEARRKDYGEYKSECSNKVPETETVEPQKPYDFFPALPEKYMEYTDNLQFALTSNYRKEIIRNAKGASEEWGHERGFDTCVREYCLKSAEAHAEIAFFLIADCIYDPKTNYFDRNPEKRIALNAMLYRMWFHQTGKGLIWYRAEIPKLEESIEIYERGNQKRVNKDDYEVYWEFVIAMKKHENDYKGHIGWPACNVDEV